MLMDCGTTAAVGYRFSSRGNRRQTWPLGSQVASTTTALHSVPFVGWLNADLEGDLRLRLIHPLYLQIEDDEDGGAIVSDSLFGVYGEGKTLGAAIEDFRSALTDFYFLLRERSERSSEDADAYSSLTRIIEAVPPQTSTASKR